MSFVEEVLVKSIFASRNSPSTTSARTYVELFLVLRSCLEARTSILQKDLLSEKEGFEEDILDQGKTMSVINAFVDFRVLTMSNLTFAPARLSTSSGRKYSGTSC